MTKEVFVDILLNTMLGQAEKNMPLKLFYHQDNVSKHSVKLIKVCLN